MRTLYYNSLLHRLAVRQIISCHMVQSYALIVWDWHSHGWDYPCVICEHLSTRPEFNTPSLPSHLTDMPLGSSTSLFTILFFISNSSIIDTNNFGRPSSAKSLQMERKFCIPPICRLCTRSSTKRSRGHAFASAAKSATSSLWSSPSTTILIVMSTAKTYPVIYSLSKFNQTKCRG